MKGFTLVEKGYEIGRPADEDTPEGGRRSIGHEMLSWKRGTCRGFDGGDGTKQACKE